MIEVYDDIVIEWDINRKRATKTAFRPGQFVCEFEANLLTREQFQEAEKEYQRDNLPIYTLEVRIGMD